MRILLVKYKTDNSKEKNTSQAVGAIAAVALGLTDLGDEQQ